MILTLEDIYGGYRKDNNILNGISLDIKEGETLAVIGQNGAGKSTLAKAVVNTLPFRTGKVVFNGMDITMKTTEQTIKFGIGFFLQGGRIFPHLNIHENMKIAAQLLKKADFDKNILELSEFFPVLINNKLSKQASELSGGEKHQLALCMVLINKPKLLILDEPSAGLSPQNTEIVYNNLQSLKNNYDISILLIEQNIHEAIRNCDRMVILNIGRIIKEFTKGELDNKELDKLVFEKLLNLPEINI